LDVVEKERPKRCCNPLPIEVQCTKTFHYKTLSDEIQVGGIYVKFFNKGGTSSLPHVDNLGVFFDDIVAFVGRTLNCAFEQQPDWEVLSTTSPRDDTSGALRAKSLDSEDFHIVLIALCTLCQIDGLVEDSMKRGNVFVTATILSLLELPAQNKVSLFPLTSSDPQLTRIRSLSTSLVTYCRT
jgi:hypothetical protein